MCPFKSYSLVILSDTDISSAKVSFIMYSLKLSITSDISPEYLLALVNLIIHPEMHNGIFFKPYDEVADFLDGNGFKVEGSEKYGYTITLLKTWHSLKFIL